MILVTGGGGFIGSHLLDRLARGDEPVRALLRRKTELPARVEPAFGDLAENRGLRDALREVTTIIHLAGTVQAIRPGDYYRGNIAATENLAREAAGRGIRFVHVSSLAATGPCSGEAPVNEETACAPITDYGKSKLEAEGRLRAVIPDAVIVRPPVVYGPRDRGVFTIFQSIRRGIDARIGGGERWFSLVYVDDLIDGLLAAANAPQAAGRTYFISHAKPENWSTLSEAAARTMHCRPRMIRIPLPLAYAVGYIGEISARMTGKAGFVTREKVAQATQRRWVCDPRRAEAELGFRASTSVETGLQRTLAWYKEAGWLKW